MMERLTEKDEFGNADIIALSDMMPEIYAELSFSETNALTDALNRLAAYEDTGLEPEEIRPLKIACQIQSKAMQEMANIYHAQQEGRLVVLPCKVGDLLWQFDLYRRGVISFNAPDIHWIIDHLIDFGKTIFLTPEAAEAALEGSV